MDGGDGEKGKEAVVMVMESGVREGGSEEEDEEEEGQDLQPARQTDRAVSRSKRLRAERNQMSVIV